MTFDVDAYLEGRLTEEEQAQFETELANNPALRAELEDARAFREHLRTMRIRARVKQVLHDEPAPPPAMAILPWFRRLPVLLALALLLIAGGIGLWWWLPSNPTTSIPTPVARERDTLPVKTNPMASPDTSASLPISSPKLTPKKTRPIKEVTPPPTKPILAPKPTQPMAKTDPKRNKTQQPPPDRPEVTRGAAYAALSPALRKIEDALGPINLDTAHNRFSGRFQSVVALLKEGRLGAANGALGQMERNALSPNDTLNLLRGYTLLSQEASEGATEYLEQLDKPGHPWRNEVLWYLGRAALLEGDAGRAKGYWERVEEGSVYGKEAKRGVRLLEGRK